MTSHTYDFRRDELLRLILRPLIPAVAFAAVMHLGAALRWLPVPRPALDIDRTILLHKVEACRAPQEAEIVLFGDSSCLVDVAARPLAARLGRPVLNLGTLSYLDLSDHALLLREYAAANPGRLRAVAVLLHPEALRRPAPETYHRALLQAFLRGEDHLPLISAREWFTHLLGLEAFRSRILARVLPTPLPGAYGRYYGFTADLEAYLKAQAGSAVDPDSQPSQGNAEYRLATQLEPATRAFRAAVPAGVRLFVGITPVPEGFVPKGYGQTRDQMLTRWSQWLQADTALFGLPPTLADRFFASTTHLNAQGARVYTELLAGVLSPHTGSPGGSPSPGR